jgi:hypothetical protein
MELLWKGRGGQVRKIRGPGTTRHKAQGPRRALLDTRKIYRDHDTHEDCEKHEVCYTIRLPCAYADLADDELFAYTHVEIL